MPTTNRRKKEIEKFVAERFRQVMNVLDLDGYKFYVLQEGDNDWSEPANRSFSVRREYPYKRIFLYVGSDIGTEDPCGNMADTLIHEGTHIVLWELCEVARDRFINEGQLEKAQEETTDRLAEVISRQNDTIQELRKELRSERKKPKKKGRK